MGIPNGLSPPIGGLDKEICYPHICLTGLKVARSAPVISHLLFADDSIFFPRATLQEAESLKGILATYERVSEQVINLDKSMLSCS